MTFLATWECASDCLEMLPKFKMATRCQLQIFLWGQNLKSEIIQFFAIIFPTIWRCAGDFQTKTPKTLKAEIIQILLSHSPRYRDVQVIF